jgi:hypothetical protein
VAALLVFAGLIVVPYLAGRLLWRVKMPLPIRITAILAVPAFRNTGPSERLVARG